ncbi:hypothetical protein [Halobacillus sp. H74]|uniref:hypothetical protein n=1 Tax=Halobacillus sp. H74 TaxID=3457436 RepID=UPI003FCEE001
MKGKILDVILISGTSFFITLFYFLALKSRDLQVVQYGKDIATFNITSSIGLGALLIATVSLIQKSQLKGIRPQIITFLNEFVGFVLVNFLLLLATYTDYDFVIHIMVIVALICNVIIIMGSRAMFKLFYSKVN